jgi:hypothetical protein
MNLTLYFRLILSTLFQSQVTYDKIDRHSRKMSYDNQLFHCPRVWAKDGFSVSLQIHNGNYCSSENGYREFGHTMEEVEFGFPSENEPLMHKYSEMYGHTKPQFNEELNVEYIPFEEATFDITDTVGRIPVSVMEEVFEKHGGIDWEKTISVEAFDALVKKD